MKEFSLIKLLTKITIPQDFWHGKRSVGKHIYPGQLGGYYSDLSNKTHLYKGVKSSEGVPLVYLGKRIGYVLHPVTVCQVGLGWHEVWLDNGQEQAYNHFISHADWLVNNHISHTNLGVIWPVPYAVPFYNLSEGWISSLVQGQAISLLARALKETQKEIYLNVLIGAFRSFTVPVECGGTLSLFDDGDIFFEEYPCHPYSRVLNGFISSLWGVYDYYLVTRDSMAINLLDKGITTLEHHLADYDTGYWSRYSLYSKKNFSNLASPYYHMEHIEQLKALYLMNKRSVFRDYYSKWEKYFQNTFSIIRVLAIKSISMFFKHKK